MFLLIISTDIKAQVSVRDSVLSGALIHVDYGVYLPMADLADRFGFNGRVDIGFLLKNKKNLLIGPTGGLLFGNRILDSDVLAPYRTASGPLIGGDGFLADVTQFERGYMIGLQAGKIFNKIGGANPNSGLVAIGGLGFIQHKIRLEDLGGTFTLLTDDLRKGLDRLTNGIYISQFIGYNYMDNSKFLNFSIGIELMEAFTANRRSWNIDTMETEDDPRLDMTAGLKVAWILPVYTKPKERFYKF